MSLSSLFSSNSACSGAGAGKPCLSVLLASSVQIQHLPLVLPSLTPLCKHAASQHLTPSGFPLPPYYRLLTRTTPKTYTTHSIALVNFEIRLIFSSPVISQNDTLPNSVAAAVALSSLFEGGREVLMKGDFLCLLLLFPPSLPPLILPCVSGEGAPPSISHQFQQPTQDIHLSFILPLRHLTI